MPSKKWSDEQNNLLLSLNSDTDLQKHFPRHQIASLRRRQRKLRARYRATSPLERLPRILVYDIETFPMLVETWQSYKVFKVNRVLRNTTIASFSYRWLGEDKIHNVSMPDFGVRYKADPFDDYDVVKKLRDLFSEADVIIAHNNNRFDEKKARARFTYHRIPLPTPVKRVDTLAAARRYFGFDGNSLNELADFFGIGRKVQTGGYQLWVDCMDGNKEGWAKMIEYCSHDVQLLHEIYWILLPYIENHPNVATLAQIEDGCSKCGHKRLQREKWYSATTYSYPLYRCLSCGGYNKERTADKELVKPQFTGVAN